jgi:hypothetical protein
LSELLGAISLSSLADFGDDVNHEMLMGH